MDLERTPFLSFLHAYIALDFETLTTDTFDLTGVG